jgi:putative oxidoreductase
MALLRPGKLDRTLEPYREYSPLFIRLIVGYRLVWGTADNVFSYDRMLEFSEFVAAHGVPWPLFAAFVSAYAQFIAGVSFILGAWTRPAAAVMLLNFTVALLLVHIGQPFLENYDALVMLFGAAFLFLHGAGSASVDAWRGGLRASSPLTVKS